MARTMLSAIATRMTRPLVLAPPRARYRAWARWVLVCALVAAGTGAGYLRGWQVSPAAATAQPAGDEATPALRRQLDNALVSLRLAQAHGGELERQLDTLQQRLQVAQEEVTFLRQARDARRR